MKGIILLLLAIFLFSSCGGGYGEFQSETVRTDKNGNVTVTQKYKPYNNY